MVMPGVQELVIIGLVLVLFFGASKLPKLGGAIGESIKNFKKGISDTKALNKEKSMAESSDNNSPANKE